MYLSMYLSIYLSMYPSICRKPLFDNAGVGMDYETIEDEDARNNNSTINIHKQNQINKVERFIYFLEI